MKSVNCIFGAYFLLSSFYIFYMFLHNQQYQVPSASRIVKRSHNATLAVPPSSAENSDNSTNTGSSHMPSTSLATSSNSNSESFKLRVQSWNIRSAFLLKNYVPINVTLESLRDSNTPTNDEEANYYWNWKENSWCARRIELAQYVEFVQPDIFAVEEALHLQVQDLNDLLPDYDWVGVGRTDNKTKGEYEAIFYNKNTVKLENWDTFWLSDDPFIPSKAKCAGSVRSATVANFAYASSGAPFTIINTHWDDKCNEARELGASLIKYRGAYEFENHKGPVILTGDFNSEANGETNGGYQIVTGNNQSKAINSTFESVYKSNVATDFKFTDSYLEAKPENRIGNYATFTGFYKIGDSSKFTRIDFHMAGTNGNDNKGVTVKRHYTPDMFSDIGFHLSDHRSVISDYEIIPNSE